MKSILAGNLDLGCSYLITTVQKEMMWIFSSVMIMILSKYVSAKCHVYSIYNYSHHMIGPLILADLIKWDLHNC